jgi:outer membrane protein OmpA-like peptidoglycan-associated protein
MKAILLQMVTFAVLLLGVTSSFSQPQSTTDKLYFVVIGAFANPNNAAELTEDAKKKNLDARFAVTGARKLHFVYILETPERDLAISEAVKLQKEATYSDTWVYIGLLGDHPTVVQKKELVEAPGQIESKPDSMVIVPAVVEPEVKQPPVEPAVAADGSKPFIFKIRSIDSGQEVAGDVDIFDADIIKGRKVVSYRGNDVVNVKPISKSGNIAVVCDVFGYRKIQLPINFNEPKAEDAISLEDGKVVVSFDLVRLKKGDKVVMYNVYFFNHAAIMRPESRFEVNALFEMLKEKPTTKIRIHGHTNGNDFGKIITLGNSDDFFSLSPGNNEGKGSATKLSEERARIIQTYLVKEGIDINRMEIKAWGGKVPIYDEDHSLAQANVRVEVEILED